MESAAVRIQQAWRRRQAGNRGKLRYLSLVWNLLTDDEERLSQDEEINIDKIERLLGPTPSGRALMLESVDGAGESGTSGAEIGTRAFCKQMVQAVKRGETIGESTLRQLLAATAALLTRRHSEALATIQLPDDGSVEVLTLVGDLHGQAEDLLEIFARNGRPSERHWYLFNGDLVDRGPRGVEVCAVVFAYMVAYPGAVFVNRGNHESRSLNEKYAFDDEVRRKYGRGGALFGLFQAVFELLPLASVVNGHIFVVHGGVPQPPDGSAVLQLRHISELPYRRQVPSSAETAAGGPLATFKQLVWNDPKVGLRGYEPSSRGKGVYYFGADVTHAFLDANGLQLLVRSHELVPDGYETLHGSRLITLFSASNYCGTNGNYGAIINVPPDVHLSGSAGIQLLRFDTACSILSSSSSASSSSSSTSLQGEQVGGFIVVESMSALQRDIVQLVSDRIFMHRDELTARFESADADFCGHVGLDVWKATLNDTLRIDLPWLFLRHHFATADYIVPAAEPATQLSRVHYGRFLRSFKITVASNLVANWQGVIMDEIVAKFLRLVPSLDALFAQLDGDGDGRLTADEFVRGARASGIELSDAEVTLVSRALGEHLTRADFTAHFTALARRLQFQREHKAHWINAAVKDVCSALAALGKESLEAMFVDFIRSGELDMSYQRFRKTVKSLVGADRFTKEETEQLARYIDTDQNERISFHEFQTAFFRLRQQQKDCRWIRRSLRKIAAEFVGRQQSLKHIFHQLDRDGSGALSWPEFEAALTAMNAVLSKPLTSAQIKQIFFALDVDGSGQIEAEEFMNSFQVKSRHRRAKQSIQ